MNIIYSFTDSFKTYSLRSKPCAWFIARHWGAGTHTFLGKPWFTEGSPRYLNHWEKQESLPNTKIGSNKCFIITHCPTFCFSSSSRNIRGFLSSHRPALSTTTPPKASDLTILSSPGTHWPRSAGMSSVFHLGAVVPPGKICQLL